MLPLHRIVLTACVLVPFAGGCGSKFAGEWVQESAMSRTGTLTPVSGNRRLALQFTPPSTVRVGMYIDAANAIEPETVAVTDYQTIQNRSVAQFGSYTARVENGELVAWVGSEQLGRFRRLKGDSVFPPLVKLPQFVQAGSPSSELPLTPAPSAPPVEAVANATAK
jgi:hypothetical protein